MSGTSHSGERKWREAARKELERLAYQDGIRAAAAFAGTWDAHIDCPYRFEDVILCKFNLGTRKRPRLKRRKHG